MTDITNLNSGQVLETTLYHYTHHLSKRERENDAGESFSYPKEKHERGGN
jgi:hypothetical protein